VKGAPVGSSRRRRAHLLAAAGVLAAAALVLAAMGRPWWCRAGDRLPWSWEVLSRHNSQHLLDPYTFTHVLHGLAFYWLAWLALRRVAGTTARAWAAYLTEVAWEIIENTDVVIEHYRTQTISLHYYGDSVANSVADVLAYGAGYWVAGAIPVWTSIAAFVLVEGVLFVWIRDGFLLNVLGFLAPTEALER
jgi:hypothetical protein